MRAYRRDSDETKCVSFLINSDELLEKYNEIWEKVKNSIKKKKMIVNLDKAKIKSYNGKIYTNSHNKEIPKEQF